MYRSNTLPSTYLYLVIQAGRDILDIRLKTKPQYVLIILDHDHETGHWDYFSKARYRSRDKSSDM